MRGNERNTHDLGQLLHTWNSSPGKRIDYARMKTRIFSESSIGENVAIAMIPLALIFMPVSAKEKTQDLFCVIVMNVFASSSLLVKGIELWREIQTRPSLISGATLAIERRNHSIIIRSYNIKCTGSLNLEFAYCLIFSALWITAASIYVEFLFWRRRRLQQIEVPVVEDKNILSEEYSTCSAEFGRVNRIILMYSG